MYFCDPFPTLAARWSLLAALVATVGASALWGPRPARGDLEDYAFVPGPNAPKDLRPGPGSDLSGMDLRESAFVGMDISHARFDGSNLRNASFGQVRMESGGASFRDADLRGATFYQTPLHPESDFSGALINGARWSDFGRDFLSWEQIRATRSYELKDLREVLITGRNTSPREWTKPGVRDLDRFALDLKGFDLRGARLWYGDFTESDFTGANLRGASFHHSKIHQEQIVPFQPRRGGEAALPHLREVRPREDIYRPLPGRQRQFVGMMFSGMDLRGWSFAGADLRGVTFWNVDLEGVDFTDGDLRGAGLWYGDFTESDFTGADVRGTIFSGNVSAQQIRSTLSYQVGDLTGVAFVGDFTGFNFSRQNLTDTNWGYCNLTDADFSDAVITGANFYHMRTGPNPDQLRSTWNYRNGRMESVTLPRDWPEDWDSEEPAETKPASRRRAGSKEARR